MPEKINDRAFFERDCTIVAAELVGKILVRDTGKGEIRLRITEAEAYRGEDDTACHAYKRRTARTEVLYGKAGILYVYLCYGIHWMLNIVTGQEENAQAVLIRACEEAPGPGRLTRALNINGSFNGRDLLCDSRLRLEDDGLCYRIIAKKRVGIDYAQQRDVDRLWRFVMGSSKQ